MTGDVDRSAHLTLALGQLPALMSAGVELSDATDLGARSLPDGKTRRALLSAAASLREGVSADDALEGVLPDSFEGVLGGERAALGERLDRLASYFARLHGTSARVAVAVRYPLIISCGLLLTFGGMLVARHIIGLPFSGLGGMGRAPGGAILAPLLITAPIVYLCISALFSGRRGELPWWARQLPGGDCLRLARFGEALTVVSLLTDGRLADRSMTEAVAEAVPLLPSADRRARQTPTGTGVATLRRAGLPGGEALLLELGDARGDAHAAADRVARRLGARAARHAKQLERTVAVALLFSVGAAIVVMSLSTRLLSTFGPLGFLS